MSQFPRQAVSKTSEFNFPEPFSEPQILRSSSKHSSGDCTFVSCESPFLFQTRDTCGTVAASEELRNTLTTALFPVLQILLGLIRQQCLDGYV
jgi:hypothetical protein